MRTAVFLYLSISACCLSCKHGHTPLHLLRDTLVNQPDLRLVAVQLDSAHFRFEFQAGKITGKSQPLELLPAVMHVHWHDRDFAFLSVSCGTSCTIGYLLPLNGRDSLREYFQPLHIDRERRLIVLTETGDLQIEHFVTGRRVSFHHGLQPPDDRNFIDSVRIEGPQAIVHYNIGGKQRKKVRIDITALNAPH